MFGRGPNDTTKGYFPEGHVLAQFLDSKAAKRSQRWTFYLFLGRSLTDERHVLFENIGSVNFEHYGTFNV